MAFINQATVLPNIDQTTIEKVKKTYEHYMFFIGIVGQLLFYFQAYQIFSLKSACSVSLVGFCISLVSLISWGIYGIVIKSKVLILSNIVGFIGCVLVLTGIYIYS